MEDRNSNSQRKVIMARNDNTQACNRIKRNKSVSRCIPQSQNPYVADLYEHALILSDKECRKLHKKVLKGDIDARNILVRVGMRWAFTLAQKYANSKLLPSPMFDDVVQSCNLKLIEIVHRWIPSKGKFTTFLTPCIQHHIFEYCLENYGIIYIPITTRLAARRLTKEDIYSGKYTSKQINRLVAAQHVMGIKSIDELVTNPTLSTDEDNFKSPEDLVKQQKSDMDSERLEDLDRLMPHLSSDERLLLKYRYTDGMTAEEIGKLYGVTRSRINQKFDKLLGNMRASLMGGTVYFPSVTLINRN